MTLFDASGTVVGSSTASGLAIVAIVGSATFAGASSFTALGSVNQLVSAFFRGSGALDWDYLIEGSATFAGASSATADALRVSNARASLFGSSSLLYSTPLVVQGASVFALSVVVDVQLPPIKAITMGPKTFRWLQPLQRGDLSVFICEGRSPIVPANIGYNLVQLRFDGTWKYVGPQNRSPVAGEVGEFYATGRAGEAGQPGQWLIEWVYQRTLQSTAQVRVMPFQVLDAVAVGDPRETLQRKIKFGWS